MSIDLWYFISVHSLSGLMISRLLHPGKGTANLQWCYQSFLFSFLVKFTYVQRIIKNFLIIQVYIWDRGYLPSMACRWRKDLNGRALFGVPDIQPCVINYWYVKLTYALVAKRCRGCSSLWKLIYDQAWTEAWEKSLFYGVSFHEICKRWVYLVKLQCFQQVLRYIILLQITSAYILFFSILTVTNIYL